MTENNITSAIKILGPLADALETAYWDSSQINVKDRIFDLVSCIHAELNELAKLSISDLDMPYEAITPAFSGCCDKLVYITKHIDDWFPRTQTAVCLKSAIHPAASLLSECRL